MRAWQSIAVCVVCCVGCSTPQPLPPVDVTAGDPDAYFDVYETQTEHREGHEGGLWGAAYVEKLLPAPGYYPVVFFRCLDEAGVTRGVPSEAKRRLAYEGRGVRAKIECKLPAGTARVEVTIRSEGGPFRGEPKPSAAGGRSTIEDLPGAPVR